MALERAFQRFRTEFRDTVTEPHHGDYHDARKVRPIGPSRGEVIGITAVVAVETHHEHHTLKGCVTNSPAGQQLQIRNGARTYSLSGNTANIQAGGKVRLSGTRLKQPKDSPSNPVFMVHQMSKDYGFCTSQAGSSVARR